MTLRACSRGHRENTDVSTPMASHTPRADYAQRNAALLAAYSQCRSIANRNARSEEHTSEL